MKNNDDDFLVDDIPPPSPENIEHCCQNRFDQCNNQIHSSDDSKNKSQKKFKRTITITPPRLKPKRQSGWDIFPHQLLEYQEKIQERS